MVRRLCFIFIFAFTVPATLQAETTGNITFAIIGDFGSDGPNLQDVSTLIKSWKPDFILTLGDNNYPDGSATTIDANIGQYFHDFIFPYTGKYGTGADSNRLFPALGNHDWRAKNAQPYLDYFSLPYNERYYDFVKGPVHFFIIDSDPNEPDGNSQSSIQAQWLEKKLTASTAPWKIVCFHHPPYSSGKHGSNKNMQWPFKKWGASLVLSGHDHTYERLKIDGLTYIVNGLGGRSLYDFGTIVSGSIVRYNKDYGGMRITVNNDSLNLQFFTRNGEKIDDYTLTKTPTKLDDGQPRSIRPTRIFLGNNYPNPFNPGTTIRFRLANYQSKIIRIHIFDSKGAVIRTLTANRPQSGGYRVYWDGQTEKSKAAPTGRYYYQIENGLGTVTGKMLLIK